MILILLTTNNLGHAIAFFWACVYMYTPPFVFYHSTFLFIFLFWVARVSTFTRFPLGCFAPSCTSRFG